MRNLMSKKLFFGRDGLLLLTLLFSGCDAIDGVTGQQRSKAKTEESLPFDGEVFDLLLHAPDAFGRRNVSAIDHSRGDVVTFKHVEPRTFKGDAPQHIGFHPGVMTLFNQQSSIVIHAAEGEDAMKAVTFDPQFKVTSSLAEGAPRYLSIVDWPSWGKTLAVSPYRNGYLDLLKDYNPEKGEASERIIVPLAASPNTIRAAEKVTVGDLDGDGIAELLVVFSSTNEMFVIKYPGEGVAQPPKAELLFKDDRWGMPNEAQIFDLDGDGDHDILLPDEAKPSKINVLVNDGKGQFTPEKPIDFPGQDGIMELRIAKDKDGRVYLLAAGFGTIVLYQKPEHWTWGDPMPFKQVGWIKDIAHDMAFEDLDGDGWLDGVLGRVSGKKNIWLVYGPLWDQFSKLSDEHFVLQ
jgi:hypothetical protein